MMPRCFFSVVDVEGVADDDDAEPPAGAKLLAKTSRLSSKGDLAPLALLDVVYAE